MDRDNSKGMEDRDTKEGMGPLNFILKNKIMTNKK